MAGPFRLAVIADAHFHDPEGEFGAGLMRGDRRLAFRSWAETATAARAFNESRTALVAALDRIVAADIRLVVLAGDYSDDGQAENLRRLAELLHRYQRDHGLRVLAVPGNHDCFALGGKHTAAQYLAAPGVPVLITSDPDLAAASPGAILTGAMRCAGLPQALEPMAGFGLFRQPQDLHWESPFGPSDAPQDREYAAVSADGSTRHRLMDASYLVEPEPGLWLLMLDANVFEPRANIADPHRKRAFAGAADAGWNAVLRIKPFLLDWIADVCTRAEALGKVLVPVSHYPVLPPFGDHEGAQAALFPGSALARRMPGPAVGKALAAAGMRFHMGGHLHVNSRSERGGLTDLSLPSTTAFPAAFTVLTLSQGQRTVETVSLAGLSTDPALDALYQAEGAPPAPPDFGAFLTRQRRAHLLSRRLPRELPRSMIEALAGQPLTGLLAMLTDEPVPDWANRHGLTLPDCTALELIADALMLRDGGSLAALPPSQLALCRAIARDFPCPPADQVERPVATPAQWLALFFAMVSRARGSGDIGG